jgi:hypothetical protein
MGVARGTEGAAFMLWQRPLFLAALLPSDQSLSPQASFELLFSFSESTMPQAPTMADSPGIGLDL